MAKPTTKHIERVKKEMLAGGVTKFGLHRSEARFLPSVIHQDEKIGGVVTGWYEGGTAMLVATNRRVLFIDKKPMYTTKDEVTYDVVSGVRLDVGVLATSVTLHTRIKDYMIKYASPVAARKFISYIENKQLEVDGIKPKPIKKIDNSEALEKLDESFPFLTDDAKWFLDSNRVAVLSTKDRKGQVSGAVIYYMVDNMDRIYMLTKEDTHKARNMAANPQVALTIFDEENFRTLQINGIAEVVTDQKIKDYVHAQMTKPEKSSTEKKSPPVAKLKAGAFAVFKVTIKGGEYTDFGADKLKS